LPGSAPDWSAYGGDPATGHGQRVWFSLLVTVRVPCVRT
jgi:hypothetical protein